MSLKAIRSALVEAYLEVADWPTAYENNDRPPESIQTKDPKTWAVFAFEPGMPTPTSLGAGGYDEVIGYVQIELHYPIDIGIGAALKDVDKLRDHFVAGRSFVYDEQPVKITRCGSTASLTYGDHYREIVTIHWRAWIQRKTF